MRSAQPLGDDYFRVGAEITCGQKHEMYTYYVRMQDRDIKLEWEASVGFWSVPVKTYLAVGGEEVVARVTAEIGDFYNYDFSDREDLYQAVDLQTVDKNRLHGYVPRHKPVFNDIMEILMDGQPHHLTLEIAASSRPGFAVINRLLSKSWLYNLQR